MSCQQPGVEAPHWYTLPCDVLIRRAGETIFSFDSSASLDIVIHELYTRKLLSAPVYDGAQCLEFVDKIYPCVSFFAYGSRKRPLVSAASAWFEKRVENERAMEQLYVSTNVKTAALQNF